MGIHLKVYKSVTCYAPFSPPVLKTTIGVDLKSTKTLDLSSPGAVLICSSLPGVIISNTTFQSQKYPSLDDKLYGHPSYKIMDAIYLIGLLGTKHVCLEYFP